MQATTRPTCRIGGCFLLTLAIVSGASTAAEPTAPRPAWTTSKVVGAPTPPEPYRIVPAYPRHEFTKPTSLEEIPGTKRMLVTEMSGAIFTFPKDAATAAVALAGDLRTLIGEAAGPGGVSLFDAELHPRFSENRFLYVCYVHPGEPQGPGRRERHTRVSRWTLDQQTAPQLATGSEVVLLTWPAGGHNGGCLEFGRDGMLYISTGDGSGPNPPDGLTTGQTVDDLLGALLRIDVDRSANGLSYAIPSDNPFVDRAGARPEIWSYGLRNPFKFGVDQESNDVFVADNGWETWELIHRAGRGTNCGWPVMEGRAVLRSEVPVGPTPITPPIKDHPHTEANSVIGGPVYRGGKLPGLEGAFIYGDYITGTIWSVKPDRDGAFVGSTLLDTDQRIVAFAQGSDGELFVLDYDFTGRIYQIVPNDEPDRSASFPRRLSETGLFAALTPLTPAPGVVSYEVVAPRWVDGARAERFAAVPGESMIRLAGDSAGGGNAAEYPEGTVLVKHLTLPRDDGATRMPLETQLLHFERGTWRPYSYLWNAEGSDAQLVDSTGASRPLSAVNATSGEREPLDRTWHVNATNECKLCHNAGPGFVLGFTLEQLARGSGDAAQLQRLRDMRVLGPQTPTAVQGERRLVDPHDAAQSVDDRARSYLHANCAMCHHPGGNAIVSFYLRRDLPFEKLNTNKGTGIGTFGMHDAKIIAPGDPYRSVLMYRMSKLGYARMPYIGSRVVDSRGVALIEQWIRSLPVDADGAARLSTPARPGAAPLSVDEAVQATESALALAAQVHGGRLSAEQRAAAVKQGTAAPSDIRGLFETFVPESQRRPVLGEVLDPAVILAKRGDRDRGKLIFFSDGARCRNCHELDDREQSLGPTLREVMKKYPDPTELLRHVLQPSLKIDEPFAAYTAVVEDGRVVTGLLIEQSTKQVTLKTADRKQIVIAREALEELRRSDKSLMPDRVLSDLTAQEAADLFEYLRAAVEAPRAP
ncbi:MAG: PQQ-dependent sugar dehydrogenase [Pirellulales bacterium]